MENIVIDRSEGVAYESVTDQIMQSGVANLPTRYGTFQIKAYKDGSQEHLATMSQDFFALDDPIVRIHSECITDDVLGSLNGLSNYIYNGYHE